MLEWNEVSAGGCTPPWLWNTSHLVRNPPLTLADGGMVLPLHFELGLKYPVFAWFNRDGDLVVVSPAAQIRRGDRIVVKTVEGEVMAKQLARKTAKKVELVSLNPDFPPRDLDMDQIAWMARIVWASQ